MFLWVQGAGGLLGSAAVSHPLPFFLPKTWNKAVLVSPTFPPQSHLLRLLSAHNCWIMQLFTLPELALLAPTEPSSSSRSDQLELSDTFHRGR